jgi:hypothetical protein
MAAIIPAAPTNVVTSRNVNSAVVSWTVPSANSLTDYGSAIIGYKVWIRTSVLTVFEQDLTDCPNAIATTC